MDQNRKVSVLVARLRDERCGRRDVLDRRQRRRRSGRPVAAAAAAVTTDESSFVAFGKAAGVGPAPAASRPPRGFLVEELRQTLLMASDAKASAGQTATPLEFALRSDKQRRGRCALVARATCRSCGAGFSYHAHSPWTSTVDIAFGTFCSLCLLPETTTRNF